MCALATGQDPVGDASVCGDRDADLGESALAAGSVLSGVDLTCDSDDYSTSSDSDGPAVAWGEYPGDDVMASISALGAEPWLLKLRQDGRRVADVLELLCAAAPSGLDALSEDEQWRFLARLVAARYYVRRRIESLGTLDDAVRLISSARRVLVLTGAGISVSCGIPDFRSPGGLYDRVRARYALPQPECLFDIAYFRDDPAPFFDFAAEVLLADSAAGAQPSACHRFVARLEADGRLLRQYTQNIDALERAAGVTRLVECHGSFATSRCLGCGRKYSLDALRTMLRLGAEGMIAADSASGPPVAAEAFPNGVPRVPTCEKCGGVVKPDIVFFGEQLPASFHSHIASDAPAADLLLVVGTSLQVQPVAGIPDLVAPGVPQILINRQTIGDHAFDVELLGDADAIVGEIERRLGWRRGDEVACEFVAPCFSLFPGAVVEPDSDLSECAVDFGSDCGSSSGECEH